MALFHFLFLFLHFCSQPQLAFPSSVVKYLPGFEGPLPFELETGYVGVDEEEAVQLFYYFTKSERNPQKDPLLLWLTGGPACSSLSGMFYEIGPLRYKVEMYNGSLPTLVLNPHSWTKVSSIIFLDSPVGTGFSYARNSAASQTGDWKQVHQILQFLRKWLIDHPGFLSSPVYIGGDSYSGITVPAIVQELSYDPPADNYAGNEAGILPIINLQGYVLGNPATVPTLEANMKIPFAHGMGLISDELYESLQRNCKGEYQNRDSQNTECLRDMQYYFECISGIEGSNILEPHCSFASPKPVPISDRGRYLAQRYQQQLNPLPETSCRTYGYLLSKYWANDQNVRKALGIREGTVGEWQRCIDIDLLPYEVGILDSFQFHVNLSSRGYRSLVYSGDHDMLVPFLGTQAWIRLLNNSITDDWRPWMLQGQVAGYTRTYSNRMTFATVKGGCHTAPETKPAECFAMFKRWSSKASL